MAKKDQSENSEKKKSPKDVRLGDVWSHIEKFDGFILAAASKSGRSSDINKNLFEQLKLRVSDKGLHYYKIVGMWRCDKTGEEYKEPSLLIPYRSTLTSDEFFSFAARLAQEFDQDGVIVSTPEDKEIANVIDRTGAVEMTFSAIRYDKVADMYSATRSGAHKGRTFFFEGFWMYRPKTWMEAFVWKSKGGL